MSRATLHAYMEYFSGTTLAADLKDTIANAARPSFVGMMCGWGERHLGTNSQHEHISLVADTADYLLSGLTISPQEILAVTIKYGTEATDDYVTALPVEPYEEGDYEGQNTVSEDTPIYYVRENTLHISPTPDDAVADGLTIKFNYLPVLSDSETATNCTVEGEQLWAIAAMIQYFRTIGEMDKAAKCAVTLNGPNGLNGLLYKIQMLEPLRDID